MTDQPKVEKRSAGNIHTHTEHSSSAQEKEENCEVGGDKKGTDDPHTSLAKRDIFGCSQMSMRMIDAVFCIKNEEDPGRPKPGYWKILLRWLAARICTQPNTITSTSASESEEEAGGTDRNGWSLAARKLRSVWTADWPSGFPDLNPLENLWRFVENRHKPYQCHTLCAVSKFF